MKSLEGKLFFFKPLISSVVTQGKSLLVGNYSVNLGLCRRCSHSNFLRAGPYPMLKGLEEKSAIGKLWKVWKETLPILDSSLVPNCF